MGEDDGVADRTRTGRGANQGRRRQEEGGSQKSLWNPGLPGFPMQSPAKPSPGLPTCLTWTATNNNAENQIYSSL